MDILTNIYIYIYTHTHTQSKSIGSQPFVEKQDIAIKKKKKKKKGSINFIKKNTVTAKALI